MKVLLALLFPAELEMWLKPPVYRPEHYELIQLNRNK